jgi:hypothetical protein
MSGSRVLDAGSTTAGMSTDGRERVLSKDWRGEAGGGATTEGFEGIAMADTGVNTGCSDTRVGESTGGVRTAAGASAGGRGAASGWLSSGLGTACSASSSSAFSGGAASPGSPAVFASMLKGGAPSAALAAPVAGSAGLSGREPPSDEALASFSAPLFTALARRSCRREFGRLRDELRDASMPSALL